MPRDPNGRTPCRPDPRHLNLVKISDLVPLVAEFGLTRVAGDQRAFISHQALAPSSGIRWRMNFLHYGLVGRDFFKGQAFPWND